MARTSSLQSSRRRNKTVATIGEDGILARVRHYFSTGPQCAPDIVHGIGDDAAVYYAHGDKLQLFTIDTIVCGTHFPPEAEPERVGWKAIAINVSDIAAMGGIPTVALVSCTLRADTPTSYVDAVLQGMQRCAEQFDISIVGGDTVGGSELSFTVALAGIVEPECVCYRSGAQPGDVIAVTGRLGGAVRSGRHLDFIPRLSEARWIVQHGKPTAMMDLSDGLALDGTRLAQASNVRLCLQASSIPLSPGSSLDNALRDGEDFELLCTFSPAVLSPAFQAEFQRACKCPLTIIGEVKASPPAVTLDGKPVSPAGFNHFGRTC